MVFKTPIATPNKAGIVSSFQGTHKIAYVICFTSPLVFVYSALATARKNMLNADRFGTLVAGKRS